MRKLVNVFKKHDFYSIMQILNLKRDQQKTKYWYRLFLKQCGVKNCIRKPLHITPKYISMHNFISIWPGARIEGIATYEGEIFSPEIVLHDYVSIQQNIHLTCASRIEVGQSTAIAANVTITDIHHPYTDVNIPIERQTLEVSPVYIGEACKIYGNSVILPGTCIGKHCTVGANSVVSGVFPDYCVIVGAPARVVKQYNFQTQQWEKVS